MSRAWLALAVILAAPLASAESPPPAPTPQDEAATESAAAGVSGRFASWLEEVDTLITPAERKLFLSLTKTYQREAFVQQFWKVRDPYPRTVRNELKERWPQRVAQARASFGSLKDSRSRILLVHGPPSAGFAVACTGHRKPAEVWAYYDGSDFVPFPFFLIFVRPDGVGEAKVWRPGVSSSLENILPRIRGCPNGDKLARLLDQVRLQVDDYDRQLQRVLAKPRPQSEEWVDAFVAQSTDLPPGAEPLAGELTVTYPGRYQLRTVVQGLITVPATEVAVAEYAGYRSHELLLTGEVVRDDALFETFRYKFGVPADGAPAQIPLLFQRYLRPGSYRLILRLDDLGSKRVLRIERNLEVPEAENFVETEAVEDSLSARLYAEAAAAITEGESTVKIVPPRGGLQTGFVRFDTLVTGDRIEKVRFFLDDHLVLTKNRPPYNVEIDLGSYPDVHTLRAEGLDGEGREVAADEVLVNAGGYRFVVKLVEPRRGRRYETSIRARVEVEVPEGRSLDRVELYLNESLVATLYQEPFVQPIVLPEGQEVSYVRAVAYLPDGNSSEDLVFVNAPDYVEQVEVQFVELYSTVLDAQGRPIEGLGRDDFTVREDGVEQRIRRFERVEDQPIHVGILIDNSASMRGILDEVRKAALSFFQQAIHPKDRAAVITFNRFPNLAVELTNDRARLGGGLAGLVAEGETALYDSVMFGLYYFTGIRGQRALLVLSDGKDESSRFDFESTLDYARRAGITIYTIGLRLDDGSARAKLSRLADETGGQSFFLRDIADLEGVYGQIQRELRSQYLIAYQSSNTADDGAFRAVDLTVKREGATVKTLAGYYP